MDDDVAASLDAGVGTAAQTGPVVDRPLAREKSIFSPRRG